MPNIERGPWVGGAWGWESWGSIGFGSIGHWGSVRRGSKKSSGRSQGSGSGSMSGDQPSQPPPSGRRSRAIDGRGSTSGGTTRPPRTSVAPSSRAIAATSPRPRGSRTSERAIGATWSASSRSSRIRVARPSTSITTIGQVAPAAARSKFAVDRLSDQRMACSPEPWPELPGPVRHSLVNDHRGEEACEDVIREGGRIRRDPSRGHRQ